VAQSTVEKYRVRLCKPPSPTWKTFLNNHVQDLVALDFLVVPTVTCKVLFVLVILAHHRRRVVHFNVTEHPPAEWTTQQVGDAFPSDEAPRYLLRDRDHIDSALCHQRVRRMGIEEAITAPRSPWQNPYVEQQSRRRQLKPGETAYIPQVKRTPMGLAMGHRDYPTAPVLVRLASAGGMSLTTRARPPPPAPVLSLAPVIPRAEPRPRKGR
jgi:hypothetical protein